MKKNIYLIQPTYMNLSSVHFPYAVAALASYAWKHSYISENYELKKIHFLRNDISEVVKTLETPFLVGFSNYIWNFEYNKKMAEKIKRLYPECYIVFGGPQISPDSNLLEKHPFIDILIYYEGEVTFRDLLRALLYKERLSTISNISYRSKNGEITDNKFECHKEFDFPSPYESGVFDRLCEENPDIDFIPLVETNRGCPNNCAYCSWGKINTRVRLFPLERVYNDIEWAAKNKKEFLGFTDANFGMFPRDEQIVEKILQCHHDYGYPQKFQVSYAKDTGDRVFDITRKLNENGMDKGVTLSFQSMSKTVQENIGRSNLDIEYYKLLLKKYAKHKIPTYTDLILGLPGETLDSFKSGIDELLECGQHTSLFVHLCEWLPLSEMGKKDYMKKYRLNFTKIPLNQPHRSKASDDGIQEYSRIITSTASMDEREWVETVMFSTCVLAMHHLGILQLVALYLHYDHNVQYSDFYSRILAFMLKNERQNDVFITIKDRAENVIKSNASVVFFDDMFGDVAWPFEEYAFLKIVSSIDAFFEDILLLLKEYIDDSSLILDLVAYQKFTLKTANIDNKIIKTEYAWKDYFKSILTLGKHIPLEKKKSKYSIIDENIPRSWDEYARKVLWFGRRGGKNIYTSEIQEETM
ncbi:MAG: radical SAM protein [Ruminococcaceae bacterium]|nr:radical SAM protein [Oscillospiraceae bacterium]